nr:uncharacterized protein CTRU02_08110 [Colletotrichum truncatum]KAF6790590.1 hypothetical protein CTRU02_08110 [Colletotrichum truncatum]
MHLAIIYIFLLVGVLCQHDQHLYDLPPMSYVGCVIPTTLSDLEGALESKFNGPEGCQKACLSRNREYALLNNRDCFCSRRNVEVLFRGRNEAACDFVCAEPPPSGLPHARCGGYVGTVRYFSAYRWQVVQNTPRPHSSSRQLHAQVTVLGLAVAFCLTAQLFF